MSTSLTSPDSVSMTEQSALEQLERRVLWLATSIIHHANKIRPSGSGLKVGGHQASCASMVSIMTALYFRHLRGGDRVSVKPHAAPVLQAINYLLGRLDARFLTELRAYGGLQSYPSRTKDPFPVDFSTGSVGIGATATIWRSIAQRYAREHFGGEVPGRQIALLGDAELDEGAVWEALMDPMVSDLSDVLWVVDLNRQSLDRIIPEIAVGRVQRAFEGAGWNVITVKYGRFLREIFARPDGPFLRERIDGMGNEEYQSILRAPAPDARERLWRGQPNEAGLRRVVDELDDASLARAVRDLGGHDLVALDRAFEAASDTADRPTVVFAYTIKARRLPTEGHPANHSALLSAEQYERLAHDLGMDSADPWVFPPERTTEAELCRDAAARLERHPLEREADIAIPYELGRARTGVESTQQTLGRVLVDLHRRVPDAAERVVTVSPDVASSTNLGGWINKAGVWHPRDRTNWFSGDGDVLMAWNESRRGQHIELGIAETNLVGLLAELGTTWSDRGQPLIPIGTIYDPFVTRALEPWSFGIYAGGQSILVGTPSGVTLAPEGGAHQSVITPSVGVEQPQCTGWEPCFAQDLEWTLLHAMSQIGRPDGRSSYFRLSTRPIDQSLAAMPEDPAAREARRRDAVGGGYLLTKAPRSPDIVLVGMGAVMPEVVAAAEQLAAARVAVDVVCVTSAGLLFRAMQARQGLGDGEAEILDRILPFARRAPIVTVLDGHPHTLAFLSALHGTRLAALGVDDFGQVGDISDLYEHFGIDTSTIVGAAWDLIDENADRGAQIGRDK